MIVDPAVIATLETAIAADPGQTGIRLHLASLLLEADRVLEALEHAREVLAVNPADLQAIDLAARSAEQLGQSEVAAGYRQLLAALSGTVSDPETASPAEAPSAHPPSQPVPSSSEAKDAKAESGDRDDTGAKVVPLRLVHGQRDDHEDDVFDGTAETPDITLADVAGLEEVKRRIEISFLAPMRNPELRKMYRKSLRGGLLLYGPPGCGKTFIARAMAGELDARFLSVGLNEILDMWMGASERNLHELFELARRNAPCVLFVDEIDALGRKRSLMRHATSMTTVVNQFLTEMDGIGGGNEGVYVLAATNQPWDVDPALRRPGRLDRMLLVLPPDREARKGILEYHMRDRPNEGVGLAWVAARTDDYSGADLAHLCDVAVELAMEDSVKTGTPRPITHRDFKRAIREVRPSIRPWFETARNYALFDNEGGTYDDLVVYLKHHRMA